MSVYRLVVAFVLVFSTTVPFLSADPITITSGSAVVSGGIGGNGPISLVGTDGFSLAAWLGADVTFGPKACAPCPAGTAISFGGMFSGGDLPVSRVTYQGVTYTNVNGMISPSSVSLALAGGPVFAPEPLVESVLLTAPVTLSGRFSLGLTESGPHQNGDFTGSGLAYLTLSRDAGLPSTWDFGGVRYEFGDSASVVTPEPASLLLLGTGVVFFARRLRKRTRA